MEHKARILLLGKTGVGKSSFINYFLGKDIAEAAAGKPVTIEYFIPYEFNDGSYPIVIFDTKGLEAKEAYIQLDEIIEGIKKHNNSDNIFNWFHTIFYCVSMTNRFEEFEVDFIRMLQEELSQHIHIILTHCDTCEPLKIRHMRERITGCLNVKNNVEIFEVVCVSKRKRNGKTAQPRGREIISEKVFELLVEDIAYKISKDYARTLNAAFKNVANKMLWRIEDAIDAAVTFKTLIELIRDEDDADEHLEGIWNRAEEQMEKDLENIQKKTDQKFNNILYPVAQLYASYRSVVVDDFAEDAELVFDDTIDWCDMEWFNEVEEKDLMKQIAPNLFQKGYINENGDFNDSNGETLLGILKMITAGIGDLFSVKKNLKKICRGIYEEFLKAIPSEPELQQKAYERIVAYMNPEHKADMKKLPRLRYVPSYVTGDAQDWTYEYTWEDLYNALYYCSTSGYKEDLLLIKEIKKYFSKHPEKALTDDCPYKDIWSKEFIMGLYH